eukprot:gnl/TRDRNA2_/TRDRNA2_134259_c0_seq1.p1 gnl/TRDRNA2_/TRDRNA2_134259_c0~~gnl/TRDRNA2_/TRDRNA2_134259_c0_seq1.p1  ORF type:complete len:666 (+),score=105.72 gnl/TRDRNA2_/TRDRNA2_134259_c0_seq1:108-2000(+)
MRLQDNCHGLLLSLQAFTDPPRNHQIWRARPIEVQNKHQATLLGRLAIAGLPKERWECSPHALPPSAKHGCVVTGFYQVASEHAQKVEDLGKLLSDPASPPLPNERLRVRVVILIELERPGFMSNPDRFWKKKTTTQSSIGSTTSLQTEHDEVPRGEAVFQWWWGDPMSGFGHWKSYHPHVSARLDEAFRSNQAFQDCREAIAIDDVRYSLQRILKDRPFNYLDEPSREPFLPEHIVTINDPIYDEQARLTKNCFVQFQNGNPKRRRPVRRVRRGEAAGLMSPSGEPCNVCFSDTGVLTGCAKCHNLCDSCLRTGLRVMCGDASQTENLLCGCISANDQVALENLAERADVSLQASIRNPPEEKYARKEFDAEQAAVRRSFCFEISIPEDAFRRKVNEWYDKVREHKAAHLYHACKVPECIMDNWILRTDFDTEYRSAGKCHWLCKAGHWNCVLPPQTDIDEINRNLMLHPEFYTSGCEHDNLQLRRFRICNECVAAGLLTFAVHESGCKQWPGNRNQHRHCFCFNCAREWGKECNHQQRCTDPGIQQVRRCGDEKLEIGYVNAQEYIRWIEAAAKPSFSMFGGTSASNSVECPPTRFPDGTIVLGETRQGLLGLEDRKVLLQTMREGTS